MSHILTFEVPDEVFAELQSGAASLGVDVTNYCLRRLKKGTPVKEELTIEEDPFWRAAGSIGGEAPPDLASNHDFYLAEAALDKHEPQP